MVKENLTAEEKDILVNSMDGTIHGITNAILNSKSEDEKKQLREILVQHQQVQNKIPKI